MIEQTFALSLHLTLTLDLSFICGRAASPSILLFISISPRPLPPISFVAEREHATVTPTQSTSRRYLIPIFFI